jgi:hypothetical protein
MRPPDAHFMFMRRCTLPISTATPSLIDISSHVTSHARLIAACGRASRGTPHGAAALPSITAQCRTAQCRALPACLRTQYPRPEGYRCRGAADARPRPHRRGLPYRLSRSRTRAMCFFIEGLLSGTHSRGS